MIRPLLTLVLCIAVEVVGEGFVGRAAMAQLARERAKAEALPAARAHKKFRARLDDLKTAPEAEALVAEIEKTLPNSKLGAKADLSTWMEPYRRDPAHTYYLGRDEVRAALDYVLRADAIEKYLDLQVEARPQDTLALAERARSELSDRPAVADRIRRRGFENASRGVASLSESEARGLARMARDTLRKPEQGRDLLRRWLDDRRTRVLGPEDAEGRVNLARSYYESLDDAATAAALLREAIQKDPQVQGGEDLFRAIGFKKAGKEWVAIDKPSPKKTDSGEKPVALQTGGSLLNSTRDQVRKTLGKPDRVTRSATQGMVVEQWIYVGTRNSQYLNFSKGSGSPEPTVNAQYTLP